MKIKLGISLLVLLKISTAQLEHMEQCTISSLMTLLPRGLAVGPSLSCKGTLGLWWVGLPLETGSELPSGRGIDQDSTNHVEATVNDSSTALPLFLRFARQAQSDSQHNLSVQTQGQRVQATRAIHTGAELLLEPTQTDPVAHGLKTHNVSLSEEKSYEQTPAADKTDQKTAFKTNKCLLLMEMESDGSEMEAEGSEKTKRKTWPGKRDSNEPVSMERHLENKDGLETATGRNVGETENLETAPSADSCGVRLVSKPRLPHGLFERVTPPVHKPALSERKRLKSDQVRAGVTMEMTGDSQAMEMSGDVVTVETADDVITMKSGKRQERRHGCEMCGKKFFQKSHLDSHRLTHSSKKPFTCDQCGKSYSSKESYKAHQLNHQGKRPFQCPQCPKAYGLKRDLKDHLVLHSGLRPYKCTDCGRGFTRRPSLRVHQLLHCEKRDSTAMNPKAQVQCLVCNTFLSNSGSLKNHMKVHTGERPHICQHCGKGFSQKGNLVAHVRIHSGERPFTCAVCGQNFGQWYELQRHQQEHNNTTFLCSKCGKVLKDARSLRDHEALHSEARAHPCPHCPKSYVSGSKLRCHLRSAHSTDKPFTCHCGAAYAMRHCLTRHQALQHCYQTQGGAGLQHHCPPIRGRPQKTPKGGVKPEESTEEGLVPDESREEEVKLEERGEERVTPEETEVVVQEAVEINIV